jgi:hypothetical protein
MTEEEKMPGNTLRAASVTEAANRILRDDAPDRPTVAERRSHRRHPSSITTEVIEPRSRIRLTGRATDLSNGGCYVDTMSPFPVRTAVLIRLTSEGRSVQGKAQVVYENAGMGMGLAFVDLGPEQAACVQEWVRELSGEAPLENTSETPFGFAAPETAVAATDVREVVATLVKLLAKKKLLTHAEADEIQKQLSQVDSYE